MSTLETETPTVAYFIQEELDARKVPILAFLNLIGMTQDRWQAIVLGDKGLLLSECEAIAGALNVQTQFIVNLNMRYMNWKRGQRKTLGKQ